MLLYNNRVLTMTVAIIVVVIASVETGFSQGSDIPDGDAYISSDSLPDSHRPELWRAGGFLGFHRNLYSADDITGLPDIPSCCPSYSSGGGFGLIIGLTAGLQLSDEWQINWRGAYSSYSGQFKTDEYEMVHVSAVDSSAIALANFEHTLEADLGALTLESFLSYEAYRNLFVSAGLRGDMLISKLFRQKEFLASPEGIFFENGKRTRFEFTGEIPQVKTLQAAIVANIRYEVPLNSGGDVVVAPEVGAWYGLTDPVENLPWSIHGVRLGVSVQYLHLLEPESAVVPEPTELEVHPPIETGPLNPRATEPTAPEESGSESEAKEKSEERDD